MKELLLAVNGVFKSIEYYTYIEGSKNNCPDEYDLIMKPLWVKLKKEYDKAINEKNNEPVADVCSCANPKLSHYPGTRGMCGKCAKTISEQR